MTNTHIEDRDWWDRVGKLIGATLHSWSYRTAASFVNPQIEMSGKVANVLLEQLDEVERLREALSTIVGRGTPGGIGAAVCVTETTLVAIAEQALAAEAAAEKAD